MSGSAHGAARVAILGGGITGLTAAYELSQRARRERRPIEIVLLEATQRIGGKIVTEVRDGAVIEGGPDSFVTLKPYALELARELGLGSDLIPASSDSTVQLLRGGRLLAMPQGMSLVPTRLLPLLSSPLFSWKGKLRMALEPLIPPDHGEQDESLASFIERRLGSEAVDTIAGPLLAGIFAGDPRQLSVRSTFPQLKEFEARGGLWRGMRARRREASGRPAPAMFMTLKGGLSRLTDGLASRLPAGTVRTGCPVSGLRRRGSQWQLQTPSGPVVADAVIATIPASQLCELIDELDFELACVLREIPFVSTATASFIYDAQGFPRLSGYGFLVPKSEGKGINAATFIGNKFPERVAPGQAMIRCFIGGAGREAAAEADEQAIARAARGELRDILRLGELHPKVTRVFRWTKANPQYTVGHALRLRRMGSCLQGHPGLLLAGASYDGVGLPDCIRAGRDAAARALRVVSRQAPAGKS